MAPKLSDKKDIPPAPPADPVTGTGGLAYLEHAAQHLDDEAFHTLYRLRTSWLISHHKGKLSNHATTRLLSL